MNLISLMDHRMKVIIEKLSKFIEIGNEQKDRYMEASKSPKFKDS